MISKALISFSFDDGRIDNYTIAYPILKKYGIPATFNITTGYVEGRFADGQLTHAKPMTIDMVRELKLDSNNEIAGHGYWHENTKEDIVKGIECLAKDLDVETLGENVGFASPGTSLDLNYYQTIRRELNSYGIRYVRLSKRYLSYKWLKVISRKLSRIFHLPFLFRFAYQDVLMDTVNDDLLYSAPILAPTTVREVEALVYKAIKDKKALILMWHSIVPGGDMVDNFDYDIKKFESVCKWLSHKRNEGSLDVVKTMDIYKELCR